MRGRWLLASHGPPLEQSTIARFGNQHEVYEKNHKNKVLKVFCCFLVREKQISRIMDCCNSSTDRQRSHRVESRAYYSLLLQEEVIATNQLGPWRLKDSSDGMELHLPKEQEQHDAPLVAGIHQSCQVE